MGQRLQYPILVHRGTDMVQRLTCNREILLNPAFIQTMGNGRKLPMFT